MRALTGLLSAALLGIARIALCDALAPATLPLETQWVIHVDVDAARLSPVWEFGRRQLAAFMADSLIKPGPADLALRTQMIERITGMKLPEGLHDVTLFGTAYDEAEVCIKIHGDLDEALLSDFLKKVDPEFRQEDHNGHTLMTWRDKGRDRLIYGAFAAKGILMLSPSAKVVALALDAQDGKTPCLKADSPLVPLTGDATTLWLAGRDLAALPGPRSPIFSQLDAASASLHWADGGGGDVKGQVEAIIRLQARDEKTAQQVKALADGMKAMIALQAAEEHATPQCQVVSAALQELNVTTDGKLIKGQWALGRDKIENLVNAAIQARAAATTAPLPAGADRK